MVVVKRDGREVEFDKERIVMAIQKAIVDVEEHLDYSVEDCEYPFEIADNIQDLLERKDELNVEQIQDLVEVALMQADPLVAKVYIIYRNERTKLRAKGWEMTDLQRDIFEGKYEYNKEGFQGFLERVGKDNKPIQKMIRNKEFLPAGRILAGRGLQGDGYKITYSNCYVVTPPEDNLESIFDTAKKLARTYSYGGGCGTDISKLRPRNGKVRNAAKATSGAVSFMDLYSLTTGLIGQQNRRGALMLSLASNHPDIEEFIDVKTDLEKVTKANISVRIDDLFMQAAKEDKEYDLYFEVGDTGEIVHKQIRAKKLLEKLAKNNWRTAEPGMLFWNRIADYHLMSEDETFEYASVNPCGEEPLPAGGSCLLGSVNLSEFVVQPFTNEAYFDFPRFKEAIQQTVIYLNEILDEGLPLHPLEEQKQTVHDLRQIGCGVMGLADMLIKMQIRYGSSESINLSESIGSAMVNAALQQSALLAQQDGPFPRYTTKVLDSKFLQAVATDETMELIKQHGLRNSQLLTIAPTGSISTMIGASGGMEPIFMNSYTRKTETLHEGETYYKVYTPVVKEYMQANRIKHEKDLPDFFVTAMDLDYKDRINVQAVWQKYIDASISSTVNVPNNFSIEQVQDLYLYAWEQGLKGVTIYRDGCERVGILTQGKKKKSVDELQTELAIAAAEALKENPNQCPMCGGEVKHSGGCGECMDCGYSPCAI